MPHTGRLRARELGIRPGIYPPGPLNAITDVAGVLVGHTTCIAGEHVRTGVTAILPHPGNLFQDKVAAAIFVGNGFGKLAGATQVAELGTLETPIVLTNTLSVGIALDACVRYTLAQAGNEQVRSVNALVGETNDGMLNDIRGLHINTQHVLDAIANASTGPVTEGCVGAGTGTILYGWKGGIGSASRCVPSGYTVGILLQANFGGTLTIAGLPVFRRLTAPSISRIDGSSHAKASQNDISEIAAGDGSCMIIVATDAPLDARSLERLAARALFGLARTGASFSNGSGDYAIAFSTAPEMRSRSGTTQVQALQILPGDALSPLFQAALEASEEAVYNALFQATSMSSCYGSAAAFPIDELQRLIVGLAL